MGRPKRPIFTAEDADNMGHLKAQAEEIMKKYESLRKKAIDSKIDCKEGSMFNVIVSKSERKSLNNAKVRQLLKEDISLVEQITKCVSVRVNAKKLVV